MYYARAVMSARVLMYHGLETHTKPSEMTDPGDLIYVLQLTALERQLDWLDANAWPVRPADDASSGVVLTFDDGHVSNFELALPCLRDRGVPATFFITTDWIDGDYYMTADMLRELADTPGMTIGGHGASHAFLTDLSDTDAAAELATSRQRLEDIIGKPVTTMSAPGGRVDARIATLARAAGYTDVYTSDNQARFHVPGVHTHGRLAMKRTYSDVQFAQMIRRNREPGFLLRSGLRTAKQVLGNERYLKLRGMALQLLQRVRR